MFPCLFHLLIAISAPPEGSSEVGRVGTFTRVFCYWVISNVAVPAYGKGILLLLRSQSGVTAGN